MFLSDDDMVECPYNKTHRMLRKRLQTHLLKCRVHYPDVELRKCPFNITHLIPEPEYAHHATNCPDRKLITQYKYDAPEPKEEEGPRHAPIHCDENWDDTDVNDYNPRLHLENANVIRQPDGASKSERKLFVMKERIRLGDIDGSSDEETKPIVPPAGNAPQREDNYDSDHDGVHANSSSFRSYTKVGAKNSRKRPTSPSTSNSNRLLHSPGSPTTSKKLYRDRSPNHRISPDYSPSDPGAYYNGGVRTTNDQFNSGRDTYYSSVNNSHAFYNRNIETDPTMPEAPPPPMISYPLPRSHFSTKPQPPASGH